MPINKGVVTLLVAFSCISQAQNVCQTTDASPSFNDCRDALFDIDTDACYDLNDNGSGCKNIITYGNCIIAACIDDDTGNVYKINGHALFGQGLDLLNCQSGDKVGGYNHADSLSFENNHERENDGPACMPLPENMYDSYVNVEYIHT